MGGRRHHHQHRRCASCHCAQNTRPAPHASTKEPLSPAQPALNQD
ncbi:DUF1924 domain-containing protein [Comamonas sp. NoAH]